MRPYPFLVVLVATAACEKKIPDGTPTAFTVEVQNDNPDSDVFLQLTLTYDGGVVLGDDGGTVQQLFAAQSIPSGMNSSVPITAPFNSEASFAFAAQTAGQRWSVPPLSWTMNVPSGTAKLDYQPDYVSGGTYTVIVSWGP